MCGHQSSRHDVAINHAGETPAEESAAGIAVVHHHFQLVVCQRELGRAAIDKNSQLALLAFESDDSQPLHTMIQRN